jgi:hypothetical protein
MDETICRIIIRYIYYCVTMLTNHSEGAYS